VFKITCLRREYEELPPWYYGSAYRKWNQRVTVFAIIPLNLIIRLCVNAKYLLDSIRSKDAWVDIIINQEVRQRLQEHMGVWTEGSLWGAEVPDAKIESLINYVFFWNTDFEAKISRILKEKPSE